MGDTINEYREEWMHSAWLNWCSVADIVGKQRIIPHVDKEQYFA